jgi:hypothetical protein
MVEPNTIVDQVTPAIIDAFNGELEGALEYEPEARSVIFRKDMTNYRVRLKKIAEAEMYTIEASRHLSPFQNLLQLIAEKNIELSWCKVFYRDSNLYVNVSSLYPQDVSIQGVVKTILVKISTSFNDIYDSIENGRR